MTAHVASFTVDITPMHPVDLAGYRRRTGVFSRVATPLQAQGVIFFDAAIPIVLVAVDTLFSSKMFETAVQRALGNPVHLLVVASHTHNAPALDPTKPLLGKADATYLNQTACAIASAIKQALERPVTLTSTVQGSRKIAGNVYRRRQLRTVTLRPPFVVNRTEMVPNPERPIPQEAEIVLLSGANNVLAAIWTWPCHPVTTPDLQAVHADLPGLVRDGLRAHLDRPDLPVLFLPGFCGDIRPNFTAIGDLQGRLRFLHRAACIPRFRRPTQEDQIALADNVVGGLVAALERSSPITSDAPPALRETNLTLPGVQSCHTDGIPVRFAQLGGMSLLTIGAEVCAGHRKLLEQLLPSGALMTGCAGHVFGYLPTDAQLPEGGYEVSGHRKGFGLRGQHRPGIDALLQDAARRAVAS